MTPSERNAQRLGWTCVSRAPFSAWRHPEHGEVYRSRDHCWRWMPPGRVVPDARQWRTLGDAVRAAEGATALTGADACATMHVTENAAGLGDVHAPSQALAGDLMEPGGQHAR